MSQAQENSEGQRFPAATQDARNFSYQDQDLGHLPLSLDQRLSQGDAFYNAMKTLEKSLTSIEHFYSTPGSGEAGVHSGQPTDCRRCDDKKKQIRRAYYECYLAQDSETEQWDSNYPQYRRIMSNMFEDEQCRLEDICEFHDIVLKDHLHQDIIQSLPMDTFEDQSFSNAFSAYVWDNDASIEDLFAWYFKHQPHIQRSQAISEFFQNIQNITSAELRAQIYVKYYCTILPNDPPVLRNFKSKYARQFAELNSHDAVLAAMHEEAETYQVKTIEQLRGELGDLQLAKSATMKHKKRKAEQADQRMLDIDMDDGEYVSCALPSCPLDVELSDTIECVICDWLVRKRSGKSRVYYCSVEHSEEDFDDHDRSDHKCSMGHRCYFHPEVGPPGQTAACGVCIDCAAHDVTSYFCSQECYDYNLVLHRDEVHYMREIENNSDRLEVFKPGNDFEVVS